MLLGKDVSGENKYRRAARYFREWQKNKVLIQDNSPVIYFYSQQYTLRGEKRLRFGFIALLYLDSSIFGHEHTRLEPKEDRLKLLKAVKANLSPLFVLFSDRKRIIQSLHQRSIQDNKPLIDITDEEKVTHKVWRISAPEVLEKIQAEMQRVNIFIADGHHRYEVACAYRDAMKRKLGAITGEEDFNYILAYFTNVESKGLAILPIHRLVKLGSRLDTNTLKLALSEYFNVEEIKEKTKFFFLIEKGGQTEHVLGMYKDKKYWLLRLKNVKILDKMMTEKSRDYRSLDICILNHIVLKKVLGLDLEDKEKVTFSPHREELIEAVNNDSSSIALFLNPIKTEKIISVALNNEKMPPKTTYFYPKVLSGLVINKFEE